MLDLIIGCKIFNDIGGNCFVNIEMNSESYPMEDQADELALFLNSNSNYFIDEVVYVMDSNDAYMVWEKHG